MTPLGPGPGQPDERCEVCGVLMTLRGLPYSATHINGPVLETTTGREYPGHPVVAPTGPLEAF